MINSKIKTVTADKKTNEEKALEYLHAIDWKLWEIYNLLKDQKVANEKTKEDK